VVKADGTTVENVLKFGDVFWSEAGTHSAVNAGKDPVRVLIVEIR
jgi:hypothetical protein